MNVMRQSCPPCQRVRDANLNCRYESFIAIVVISPFMCLCECCDGEGAKENVVATARLVRCSFWEEAKPPGAKPVSASHKNRECWRVVGCDMAEWNHPVSDTRKVSGAILAQAILAQDSFRVRFLFAVYIAWPLLLVALSSSVGNLVVLDLVRSLWWNMDTKLGGSQLRAEPVGRLSRGRTSHWQISSPSRVIRRRDTTVGTSLPVTSRRSRNTSPAMSRRSSVVSWSDSPRDQAVS